jgi:hypothetical protein
LITGQRPTQAPDNGEEFDGERHLNSSPKLINEGRAVLENFPVLKLITGRYRTRQVAALATRSADPPGAAALIAYISVIIWLAHFANKPCKKINRGSPRRGDNDEMA